MWGQPVHRGEEHIRTPLLGAARHEERESGALAEGSEAGAVRRAPALL